MSQKYDLTKTVISPYDRNNGFTVFYNLEGEPVANNHEVIYGSTEVYEFNFCGPYIPFWEKGYDHEFYVHSLLK